MPRILVLVALLLLGRASAARGEEPAKEKARFNVGGWVDVYYGYNINRPFDGANFTSTTGTTAKRANEFSVNQAAVDLFMEPKPFGFHLTLGTGTGFEMLHIDEASAPGSNPNVWRYVYRASVSYTAPLGRGLLIEGGIFPSHIGLESFPSQNNWTYTRGWMGEFSPYYQTGVKAAYSFTDVFSAQLHLLNGWQNITELNEGKAVGAQFAWAFKKLSLKLNGFAGPEVPNDARGWRIFVDLVAIWQASESLSLAVTTDFGRQGRPGQSTAFWYAAGVTVRRALTTKTALTARTEVYRDTTGLITGAAQTLNEVTVTLAYQPVDQLLLKLEGRYDHSTAAVFTSRTADIGLPNQGLVVLGAVAMF